MHFYRSFSIAVLFAAAIAFAAPSTVHANPPEQLTIFPTKKAFIGLDEEIFPLGWSPDGEKLALLSAFPNEAADERLWKVQILDLVNDKFVLDLEIFHLDQGGFAAFWTAHGTTVTSAIQPFSIQSANFELYPFPALLGKFRGEPYEVSLTRTYGTEEMFGYRGVKTLQVALSNGEGKSKTILKKSWDQFFPLAAGVVGYLPNPQGDRIAVFVATAHRGYESAPHVRRFLISGARVGEKF